MNGNTLQNIILIFSTLLETLSGLVKWEAFTAKKALDDPTLCTNEAAEDLQQNVENNPSILLELDDLASDFILFYKYLPRNV